MIEGRMGPGARRVEPAACAYLCINERQSAVRSLVTAGRHDRHMRRRGSDPRLVGQRGRPARKSSSFALRVAAIAAGVFGVTWASAPQLSAVWRQATVAPEELRAVERSVYYSGCRQARAAGIAPIYRGSPGYREGLDGDGDGVACEPYPSM
jgi:hypothetical protein